MLHTRTHECEEVSDRKVLVGIADQPGRNPARMGSTSDVNSSFGRFQSNHPFAEQCDGVSSLQHRGKNSLSVAKIGAVTDPTGVQIEVEFRFDFERHPVYSDCGNCLLNLFLRNYGLTEAVKPFLCLPLLGLSLTPAVGWGKQEVINVRKLLRFGPIQSIRLATQEAVHCCTIAMPFSTLCGGVIRYAAESQHSFLALPDLRLTCIAGAGNSPSQKILFVVPASDLKTYFRRLCAAGEVPEFGEEAPK